MFDKETAISILRVLAKEHGLGKGLTCKADLYTLIGIDSKVASSHHSSPLSVPSEPEADEATYGLLIPTGCV